MEKENWILVKNLDGEVIKVRQHVQIRQHLC